MRCPPGSSKYQPFSTQAISNLKRRQVWFARPTSFNDPLDCALGFQVDEPSQEDLRRFLAQYEADSGASRRESINTGMADAEGEPTDELRRSAVSNMSQFLEARAHEQRHERGVTCFSESVGAPLLWAHYGDGHRGFCLEFDTATELFDKVHKVRYAQEWPSVGVTAIFADTDVLLWSTGVLTKAECWEYEQEWRVLHLEPDRPWVYDWRALTGVYFGAMMDPAHKEIVSMILRDSGTKCFNVRHTPNAFTLEGASVDFSPFDYEAAAKLAEELEG